MRSAALYLIGFAALAGPAAAGTAGDPDADPAFHRIDFWVGHWKVYDAATGRLEGTNHIEKILRGCAVVENWTEADGSSEGRSLFYYNPANGKWRQVWVTSAGAAKEKEMIEPPAPGAVRFMGEIALRGNRTILDRTTLQPLPDGRVRQTIEVSRDRGATWKTSYDAFYVRDPDHP
ncbi:MAG TPA: hypothetical protein VGM73_08210 [Candidatus Didemnitutus sp.]|jgi:hypothetical protein